MRYDATVAPITLDSDAVGAFELTTYLQLHYGLIGVGEYANRLDFLEELISEASEGDSSEETSIVESYHGGEVASASGYNIPIPVLELIVSTPEMHIKKWQFHKGDDDPNPSIPHGHDCDDAKVKLDAYQGYIYRRTAQIDRVSRNAIVMLWNNKEFRKFAREAIEAYVERNGYYHFRDYRRPLPKRQKR